jgi:FKBP-type peptidyl-prolyl cis-trans isomerase
MKNILPRLRYWVLAAGLLLAAPALWSCNSSTTYQQQLADHENQLKGIDEEIIQTYLKDNNLLDKATRTNSGLYLVSIADGSGPVITTGKQVLVKYVGRFLSNGAHPESSGYPASPGNPAFPAGAIFDNSSDKGTACGCVPFTVGNNTKGFDEGLLQMHKGDRKLLLVPSRLAYGPSGAGSSIPPDSALMFDVEIIDVSQ